MYLLVWGVRAEPVPVQCLAWSHGASNSSYSRYGGSQEEDEVPAKDRLDEHHKKAEKWTIEQVGAFLRTEIKLDDTTVAKFAKEKVDGEALFSLLTADYDLLIGTIGERRRAFKQVQELYGKVLINSAHDENASSKSTLSMQDMSCTLYMGASTNLLFSGPLYETRKLPRVALVCYAGGARRRNRYGGNDDDDDEEKLQPGTPYAMEDMYQVTVSSVSMGGSGGEDRLTCNVSLNFSRLVSSSFGVHDHKGISWDNFARLLQVDPRDPDWDPEHSTRSLLDRCMGVSVVHDVTNNSTEVVEWGSHVSWSRKSHTVYPRVFRQAVRTFLLCQRASEDPMFQAVPKDVMHLVVARLAKHYSASPFADALHPDPESLKPKPKKDDEEE